MMLTSTATVDLVNISMGNAAIVAVLGYAVVFFGLILLMLVVMAIGKAFTAKDKKNVETSASVKASAPAETAPVVTPMAPAVEADAPGSAGQLKLHDVPPKTAAMLMAIVANQMGKPLNELRFISIKEVK